MSASHPKVGAHMPSEQRWSTGHALPHVPQFAASVPRSAQYIAPLVAFVQALYGIPHVAVHVPAEQTEPAAHALPHVPQFALSLCVSTQAPPQNMPPAPVHVHAPETQAWPAPHALPQAPQFAGSPIVSTQLSAHLVSCGAQKFFTSTLPHPEPATPPKPTTDTSKSPSQVTLICPTESPNRLAGVKPAVTS